MDKSCISIIILLCIKLFFQTFTLRNDSKHPLYTGLTYRETKRSAICLEAIMGASLLGTMYSYCSYPLPDVYSKSFMISDIKPKLRLLRTTAA